MLLPDITGRKSIERSSHAARPPAVVPTYTISEFDSRSSDSAAFQSLAIFLWKRKWTIALAALCGLLVGVTVAFLSKPVYRARTSLKLEGFNDQTLRGTTLVSPLPGTPQDYLQNEVKVLESDTLARRVADQLGNQFGPTPQDKPNLLQQLRAALTFFLPKQATDPVNFSDLRLQAVKTATSVSTALQSQVVEVFFDASDAAVAARGANAVALEFMNLNREERQQLVQDTTEWVNKQATTLRTKLDALNRQLQDFTTRSGLILPGKQDTPVQQRVRLLQDTLTRAEADRADKQSRYEAAAMNSAGIVPDTGAPGNQYELDLQNMRRQLAELRTVYTSENYKIARLTAQIAETEAAIERQRKQALDRMRNDYAAAVSLERTLSLSLAKQLASVQQQTAMELQYDAIRNELDATQKQYDSVLERATEAGAASSLRITSIRVIDPAISPPDPYSPNLPLNMAIGLGIGTLTGVGIVLVGARSGKVKEPGELTSIYVPELGVVPSASTEVVVANKDRITPIPDKFGSPLLRESFRAILTSILFSTSSAKNGNNGTGRLDSRIMTVTSPDMMEGKTTIVTNLGIACAMQKRDVLLIDVDLRRPKLHERFGLPNSSGLTTILRHPCLGELFDRSHPESLVQPTQVPHLWVLTSGPTDAAAVNLLYSSDLESVLQYFALRFRLMFIDTPPVSLYSDARVLGRMSDGLVMVVRANTKTREELKATYQKLLQDKINVLGTILNDWKIDRDQARTYARYYDHYGQQNGRFV